MHPDEVRGILAELPNMGFPFWEAHAHAEHLRSVIRLQEIDMAAKIAALFP